MTKGEYVAMLARRLGEPLRHIERHVERLHETGMVKPVTGSRRFPPEIGEPEAVTILLGFLGSEKIDDAPAAATRLATLRNAQGNSMSEFMGELLFGSPRHIEHMIVRRESVSLVVDGRHHLFGELSEAPARLVTGASLSAIAAELQGAAPSQADAVAAITRLMK
ncbi:hypothetical protein QTA58_05080 [Neorhizobium sp. CSC1952]|uniref:hypothetical protein n=1 Tax=Neorhizobium sp. CSC1952 TaxID=2978974 RepID=UPI0025A6656E|nr:hypothetical protein [Rhizobium sp. CSC1952]WJR68134.1 hypothetical protein QTA58_05080 [Rhizobium sp. CSC1952]